MQIVPFQAIFPKMEVITAPQSFFDSIKEKFTTYYQKGYFEKYPQKAFYIYRILRKGKEHTGILANLAIQDLIQGKIKKHEATLKSKEQKQVQLLLKRQAAVKPILLTYQQTDSIETIQRRILQNNSPYLEVDFEHLQEKHQFWIIENPELLLKLKLAFQEVTEVFVADGHHRISATHVSYLQHQTSSSNPFNQLFCVLFPTSSIEVHEFNRVITSLTPATFDALHEKLASCVDMKTIGYPQKPKAPHELSLFWNNSWHQLHWKKEILQQFPQNGTVLDTMLLNKLVLEDILGIDNIRSDNRVNYVEGIKGLDGLKDKVIKSGTTTIGFALYPIPLSSILTISRKNQILPPKSTWFEPRMKNGLIVMKYF